MSHDKRRWGGGEQRFFHVISRSSDPGLVKSSLSRGFQPVFTSQLTSTPNIMTNQITHDLDSTNGPIYREDIYRYDYGETAKLTHNNYYNWSRDMMIFLDVEQALGLTLGDEEAPPADQEADLADYQHRAAKAAAMIYASCSPLVQHYLPGTRGPHEMWTELKEKVGTPSVFTITQRYLQIRPDSAGINSYIGKLLDLRGELTEAQRPISDESFISRILCTLPSTYHPIIDIISHQPKERYTVDYVIRTLITWESDMKAQEAEAGSDTNTNTVTLTNT